MTLPLWYNPEPARILRFPTQYRNISGVGLYTMTLERTLEVLSLMWAIRFEGLSSAKNPCVRLGK